ncbi:hypothetical protein [Streptomyces sp. NPDC048361]|uniref:hypothetical protein n=1 Tax=Streptomyces sp. NPDC048361 TaxID=3154720 RepID=UPI003444E92B
MRRRPGFRSAELPSAERKSGHLVATPLHHEERVALQIHHDRGGPATPPELSRQLLGRP